MSRPAIYFIRHGQTEWNEQKRIQGGKDSPLTEVGRQQSIRAGRVLETILKRDGRSALALDFVASPLGRARQTMELVRGTMHLPLPGYRIDDRLRELSYGQWEGSTLAEIEAKDPDLFARRQSDKWTTAPPDGESFEAMHARISDWFRHLTRDTVVAAHVGTLMALTVVLGLETPLSAMDLSSEPGTVYLFSNRGLEKCL